ncbi:hypothetical protein KAK07_14490 [Ideonella sp. 4Y16]|uniref:WD40/YVTN/BNR-like repeat-containing protein n=1 Tax=Ideonella alba TaxID=2824118 RepID=UPI001B381747|nr:YCF48-related protein [Ideonella alba]MBQ0944543.1 hypothetical protein [Ideonella alba]
MNRRLWLALAAATLAGSRASAAFAPDGAARTMPLAARSPMLDLTLAGQRLVAVGERGHVLLSDDQGAHWRQAQAVPTRVTLTALHASSATQLWACGHGGTILRSDDAGEHWQRVAGEARSPDVLLSIRVDTGGRGLAVGGFGFALASRDAGASWKPATLLEGEEGERHLNRVFVSAAGTWLIAAESGHVLRSSDQGDTWSAVKTAYAGSLWSGADIGGTLLAGGMRGHWVRSTDDGRSWTQHRAEQAGSITAVVPLAAGRVLMVGVDGTQLQGAAGADAMDFRRLDDRSTLTGAVPLPGGRLALAGAAGVRVIPG